MMTPEDMLLLDPEQRELLATQPQPPQMPQPVQRGPVQRMPGTGAPGIQMPGAGTPVAPPVPMLGRAGTRPGEVQVAQNMQGAGPPTAPPPGYGSPAPSGGAGQWQGKVKGGTGGFVGTAKDMPEGAKMYQPYTFKEGPAKGFTVIFKPNANMKGGIDWEKVDTPKGPDAPGELKQVGQVMMMPDKEGIMQPQSIAPTGPPGEIFEFKGKLWRRGDDGKQLGEYDPDKELVPVPPGLGVKEGTMLPRGKVHAMIEKNAEAQAAAQRELDKQRQAQDFTAREAELAARRAERKARRDKDREVLQGDDKAASAWGEQRAYMRLAEQALDKGIRTGKPEEWSLPFRQWAASFLGKKEQDQISGQELFDATMAKLTQASRAGGPPDSNFSNADLLFAMKGTGNLGNQQETNRALMARGQQILDWKEKLHTAKKRFFNAPGNEDKGLEDFNVAEHAPELERIFPTWQHMNADKWKGMRHGMVWIDGNGDYQTIGKVKPRVLKYDPKAMDEMKTGDQYIDDDGILRTKE